MIFPIHYFNAPANKILVGKTDTLLRVTVSSSGYKLLIRDLKNSAGPVYVDLSLLKIRKSGNNYESSFFSSDLNEKIAKSISKLRMISVYPSSINLVFEDAHSKKVPVRADINVSFEKQYDLYGNMVVYPDSITITGTKKELANISFVETEKVLFSNVNNTKFFTASLKRIKGAKEIMYSKDYVSIALPVAQYTEAEITVPVKLSQTISKEKLLTFPEKVNIIYYVALSDYKKVDTSAIRAQVDCEKAMTREVDKLKVDIVKSPSFIKILRVVPERVEYIIQK